MSLATNLTFKGLVEILVRDPEGALVKRVEVENKIVEVGLDLMSRLVVPESAIMGFPGDINRSPIRALGVGTGGTSTDPVGVDETALTTPWQINEFTEVQVLHASLDLNDANGLRVMTLRSRHHGSYGNHIKVNFGNPSASYDVTITDDNTVTASPTLSGANIGVLAQAINNSGLPVEAVVPDTQWNGTVDPVPTDIYLSGGGTGVMVSAQFSNSGADEVLTEAGLFTGTGNDAHMFNKVRFAPITISDGMDITFRWKLLFQEA